MQRELWELIGQFEKKIDPNALQKVNNTFEKLDIVPKDYHYPELYDLKGTHRYWGVSTIMADNMRSKIK